MIRENDCISRQSVIDLMMQKWGENFSGDSAMQESIDAIRVMPSVTPQEPKTGHWKLVQRGKLIDVCCSNCEAVRIKGYAYNYTIDELNKEDINECFGSAEMRFCPNCGSRNEVEE